MKNTLSLEHAWGDQLSPRSFVLQFMIPVNFFFLNTTGRILTSLS